MGYRALSSKGEVKSFRPDRVAPLQVETIHLRKQAYRPMIGGRGFVTSAQRGMLKPEFAGVVESIASNFDTGSSFEKGDILLELRKTDFTADLATARAELGRRQAELVEEQARRDVALSAWEEVNGSRSAPSPLVAREPQIQQIQAALAAAELRLADAERALESASVRAPFSGRVIRRDVQIGETVTPTTVLGEIFSDQALRLEVELSLSAFQQLDQEASMAGDLVALPDLAGWQAKMLGSSGQLSGRSRMVTL